MGDNPQNNSGQKLGFLSNFELTGGGIILGLIAFVLLLVVLNYFNILSLSKINKIFLPLPKKPYLVHSRPQLTPVPTPTIFPYDSQNAAILLTQYLKNSLKPEFLPATIEAKQRLVASGKQEGTDYEFGANWTINGDPFQSNFHYNVDTNIPSDMEFSLEPKGINNSTVTSELTNALAQKYLKNQPSFLQFDCATDNSNSISFCEYFFQSSSEKHGFGLVIQNGKSGSITTIFFSCRILKESIDYTQRTSCLMFREKK